MQQIHDNYSETIELTSMERYAELFGDYDKNIEIFTKELSVNILARDNQIKVQGEEKNVKIATEVLKQLIDIIKQGKTIESDRIAYAIDLTRKNHAELISGIMADVIAVTKRGKQIKAKTLGQKKYVQAIKDNTIIFCEGPAGTGKTYLAIAMAVNAYKSKTVSKIILTRPVVEAGESLGFLPGDMQEKIDPYLRPLYDALWEFLGEDTFEKFLEKGIIEVAPLAYMRGRTLRDSFIILDEAQNCTIEQIKMFLTRLGESSKMVITGDVSQTDLIKGRKTGLLKAISILDDIKGIYISRFSKADVIRHELVQNIINAFEKNNI